jgi:enamine deaminase RidA (YjgF/YER057c/UK114 family)
MKLPASLFASLFASALFALPAAAQTKVTHIQTAQSGIASAVWAGDTLYLSGKLAKSYEGDTKAQTLDIFKQFEVSLKEQGLGLGDVVQMRVYLVADAAGKLDFAGMNDVYKEFFGTAAQPNKPARVTVQVAALVAPKALVEIEVTAVRGK